MKAQFIKKFSSSTSHLMMVWPTSHSLILLYLYEMGYTRMSTQSE